MDVGRCRQFSPKPNREPCKQYLALIRVLGLSNAQKLKRLEKKRGKITMAIDFSGKSGGRKSELRLKSEHDSCLRWVTRRCTE